MVMSEIRGTLVELKDFLFNVETKVFIEYNGNKYTVFNFAKDRVLIVPDYQREIRWTKENLLSLIKDIFDSQKFLGNIIVANCGDNRYEIIDGQQRLVMLNMLVNYIKNTYGEQINDIDELVNIKLNCFDKSAEFIKNGYSLDGLLQEDKEVIIHSDRYKQIGRLTDLYNTIRNSDFVKKVADARKVISNLYKCQLNVVISNDYDRMTSTSYYLDVNLKGVKLDVEDIFKGYIFSLDSSDAIREKWVKLKSAWFKFNDSCGKREEKSYYPLMKIISHYIYSNILNQGRYSKININDDFLLTSECEVNGTLYHEGDHVVKAINNNTVIQNALDNITEFIEFMSEIISVDGVSDNVKKLFNKQIADTEIKILVNFIKKILKDSKLIIPKSLIIKYYFSVLKNNPSKEAIKNMYAIYMYDGLFILFGDTKRADVILSLLRENDFSAKLLNAIKEYLDVVKLQNTKLKSIITARSNTENEAMQYKCKTLATIYNFFRIKNNEVIIQGSIDNVYKFLNDQIDFSVEHLIVNKSQKVQYKLKNGDSVEYTIPDEIKPFNNYIFNFIFIEKSLNNQMENWNINRKLEYLQGSNIECEYSKCVIECLTKLNFKDFDNEFDEFNVDAHFKLDSYWKLEFNDLYTAYIKDIINCFIERIR